MLFIKIHRPNKFKSRYRTVCIVDLCEKKNRKKVKLIDKKYLLKRWQNPVKRNVSMLLKTPFCVQVVECYVENDAQCVLIGLSKRTHWCVCPSEVIRLLRHLAFSRHSSNSSLKKG